MITAVDFNTHLYPELINVIGRGEASILDEAIEAAEGEAIGYLGYYDTNALFALVGDSRDKTLLMRIKDMAVWHFIAVSNAGTDLELRATRYEQALKWLRDIQSAKITMKSWPLPVVETPGKNDSWKGNSKATRNTRF